MYAIWWKYHRFKCEHEPVCENAIVFFERWRTEILNDIRRRERRSSTEPINYEAFNLGWFLGYRHRAVMPTAFRHYARIPKSLVRVEQEGYLTLRLYGGVDLVFYCDAAMKQHIIETIADGSRAIYLSHRKRPHPHYRIHL